MSGCAAELAAAIAAGLPRAAGGLVVALSGGADSACLLAAAHAHVRARAGEAAPPLRALHVDHGLQSAAAEFRAACAALAARFAVPLTVLEAPVGLERGESVEAAAREARYAAFAAALAPGECLLTAHHAEDQAETVLLQALRGSGAAGLSGMPRVRRLGRGFHLRPFLGVPRAALARCAHELSLATVVDPMNLDPRFDRVHLRREVWPLLERRWPGAATALGRVAQHAAGAQGLLDALADDDLGRMRDGEALSVPRLRTLPPPRRVNALRRFIDERGARPPPSARLIEALRQLLEARADQLPAVCWGEHALRRYRDRVFLTDARPPRLQSVHRWSLERSEALELGEGLGRLRLAPSARGLALERLPRTLEVRARRGGERLRVAPQGRTQSVQHLCQAEGLFPWMRAALPFVHAGGRLVAVGDRWSAAEDCAGPGERGWEILWEDAPALS